MDTNTASLEASRNGVLWVFQLFGAILFLIAASVKLSAEEQMIEMFPAVRIGQWLRYVTGIVELTSAILLLIPALSGIGALVLVPTIGAILMHLFIIGGNPALPIGLLISVGVVAWGRKETLRLISRRIPKRPGEATTIFSQVSDSSSVVSRQKELVMSTKIRKRLAIVRIWRGRTSRERADEYEAYNYETGIKPLLKKALGVQTFREDRENETEFMTIAYWESVEAMSGSLAVTPERFTISSAIRSSSSNSRRKCRSYACSRAMV